MAAASPPSAPLCWEGSWFIYKQAGIAEASIPEVTAVYTFKLNELLPAAIRLGPVPDELEDET